MSATAPAALGAPPVQRQVGLALAGVLALYGITWLGLGPLPQDPAYHLLADTRTCLGGLIPRAGDVLTNLAIFAAAGYGLALRRRMNLAPDERPAADLLIVGAFLTALGSAYYHWDPRNATLFWDRLPMMLTIPPALVLVLADRVHPAYARRAFVPVTAFAVGSVLWWALSERLGHEDARLYLMVRVLMAAAFLLLLALRRGRHTGAALLWAALAGEVLFTLAERLDHQIFAWTGGLASGHNLKHVIVGIVLALVFAWLRYRRRASPAGAA